MTATITEHAPPAPAVDAADATEERARRGGGPWGRSHRLLTVGLIATVAGVAFEALAVATVLPATVADLGGLAFYGWAFSSFLLTNLVGIVAAGWLADRRGPALPFAGGVAFFAIGLIVGGLAPSMAVLIVGRALQGFGGGGLGSVAYVAVGRGYPESAKPRMLALLSTAWVVPGLIGPGLSGLIAEEVGWRWVFLGLAPLPPLAAALALPALRRIGAGSVAAGGLRRIGDAGQLAVGAGLLLAGLGLPNPLLAVGLAAGGILLALPAMRRLLPTGTIRAAAGLPAAIATMGLLNLGFFGVDAFVPLALVDVRGRSVAFAGLALTAATVTWTAGSWLLARLASRTSRRVLVRLGLALVAAGCALTALVLWPAIPVWLGLAAWGVVGLGMGLAFSTLSLVVLETAAPGQEGAASASLQLANVLGSGLGTGVGGALIALFGAGAGSLRLALLIQDLAMIAILLAAIAVAARLPGRPPPPISGEGTAPLSRPRERGVGG